MLVTDLVFEGGGAKGLAFVGAIRALEENGFQYRRLVGTSAGAISAACIATGFNSRTLEAIMTETLADGRCRLASFRDPARKPSLEELRRSFLGQMLSRINLPLVNDRLERRLDDSILRGLSTFGGFRSLLGLTERGGFHPGERFRCWLEDQFKDQGVANLTLLQLFQHTGVHLSVVASDITSCRQLILNHITAPDLLVSWAVRMSMSIPLLFEEVIWRDDFGRYLEQDITGHAIVDGGLLSNFPLELVTSDSPDIQKIVGGERADDAGTIGLLLDEQIPVRAGSRGVLSANQESENIQFDARMARLINAMTSARDRVVIQQHQDIICRLPVGGYSSTDFDLSTERRRALIEAGYQATKTFLQKMSH